MIEITIGNIITIILMLSFGLVLVWVGTKQGMEIFGIIGCIILAIVATIILISTFQILELENIISNITNSTIWNYRVW